MSRGKFFAFALTAIALSMSVTVAGLVAADLYLHRRAERSAGLNRWGYRGPVVGRKQAGEIRIAVLGGSTAFGYGVTWDQALPAVMERLLNQAAAGAPRVTVVNLAYNNEGAYAFLPTLLDFAYLDYDIACLYPGYNDLLGDEGANFSVYRHLISRPQNHNIIVNNFST